MKEVDVGEGAECSASHLLKNLLRRFAKTPAREYNTTLLDVLGCA
jgi:CO dehydrogenase nickel-insertion accessory protein CooC1